MSRINDIRYLIARFPLNGSTDSTGKHIDLVGAKNATGSGTAAYTQSIVGTTMIDFTAFRLGSALNFDPNDFTITGRYYHSGNAGLIFYKDANPLAGEVIQFGTTEGGGLTFTGGNGSGIAEATSIEDNDEHKFAVSFDGTMWKIYIDGDLYDSVVDATTITNNSNTFYIGADAGGANHYDSGVGDIRVYNTALTADEIAEIHSDMNISYPSSPCKQKLACCVNNGSEYVDTGIQISSADMKIELDIVADDDFSGATDQYIVGHYATNGVRLYLRKTNNTFVCIYGNNNLGASNYSWTPGTRYLIKIYENGFNVNDNRYFTTAKTLDTSTNTIKLFNVTGTSAKFWLINAKIYVDDVMVMDLNPTEQGSLIDSISGSTLFPTSGDPMQVKHVEVGSVNTASVEHSLWHSADSNKIDTGIIPTENTVWEIDCRFLGVGSGLTPIGCYDTTDGVTTNGKFALGLNNANTVYSYFANTVRSSTLGSSYGRHVWHLSSDGLKKDGVKIIDNSTISNFSTGSKTIFVNNTFSDNDKPQIEIFRSTIWENGTMIQNLVPVIGVNGLYDTVTEQVFSDSGSTSAFALANTKMVKLCGLSCSPYTASNKPVEGSTFSFSNTDSKVDFGNMNLISFVEMVVNPSSSITNVPLFRNSGGTLSVTLTNGAVTFSGTGLDGYVWVNGIENGTCDLGKFNHIVIKMKKPFDFNSLVLGRNASIGFGFSCNQFDVYEALMTKDDAEQYAIEQNKRISKGW